MSSPLPLHTVVEIIKILVDGVKCPICDKVEGTRVRYTCGHAVCDECVATAEGCVLCLTPLRGTSCNTHKVDFPFTQRVERACNLLNAYEETFNIDVNKSVRLSEQLKVEKVLFPECIQAPIKYYNKRKSLPLTKNKEYISIFPGEIVSPPKKIKMSKTKYAVQKWLENSEHYNRKALTDLDVNIQEYTNKKNVNRRKRKIFSSVTKQYTKKSKVLQKTRVQKNENALKNTAKKKCEHEESGIVLDDETIYIEDSQEQMLDKDRLALLAVEAAEREFEKALLQKSSREAINYKVPFYVKGSLVNYFCCNYKTDNESKISSLEVSKDLSISIENKNFITTINISNVAKSNQNFKSTCIQSDISDIVLHTDNENVNVTEKEGNSINSIYDSSLKAISITSSSLLPGFANSRIQSHNNENPLSTKITSNIHTKLHEVEQTDTVKAVDIPKKSKVIFNDSDSDSLFEESSILQVSADIHMPCDNKNSNVLNELCSKDIAGRSRNKIWRISPDSNNSSDKENCDPNKRKNQKVKRDGKYGKRFKGYF